MEKMKPGQISAKRAYEISDSLAKESQSSYRVADLYYNKANNKGKIMDMSPTDLRYYAEKQVRSADYNSEKAKRLKTRADAAVAKAKATAGRDMPLPSSEGMMSKIASGLSTLFKK
jgi:hypothetical protein